MTLTAQGFQQFRQQIEFRDRSYPQPPALQPANPLDEFLQGREPSIRKSQAVANQEHRVRELLKPEIPDWDKYDQELGILFHMMAPGEFWHWEPWPEPPGSTLVSNEGYADPGRSLGRVFFDWATALAGMILVVLSVIFAFPPTVMVLAVSLMMIPTIYDPDDI